VPIVQPANNYGAGYAKQSAEGTIATVATYEGPVYSGRPQPVQNIARIEVTDAASIIGDPYKQPGEHWESTVETPAFANMIGAQCQSLWPTDTVVGSGAAITKAITAATQSAGTVTFTANAHGFTNGNYVFVTGMTPATYNGFHLVSNVTANTWDVTGFATTLTTPATAFGTAVKPPYAHAFTGLGGTQSWYSMYSTFVGGMLETFEDGLCGGIAFSADESGGPMHVQHTMVGKRPTKAAHTITTPVLLTDGFFTLTAGTVFFDEDTLTPAAQTNAQKVAVTVDRPATALPTADGVSVNYIAQGKVDPSITATLLYPANWDGYQSTFWGSASGTAPSTIIVKGSLKLLYVHSVQSTWAFQVTVPSAVLAVAPPQPDPSGGPLTLSIAGYATKPASGDHVSVLLGNNVSAAF
jgi:hypothetical protein